MKLFNLTDRSPAGKKLSNPRHLVSHGLKIAPGACVEVLDNFRLGTISGWVNGGLVSVNVLPMWYKQQVALERRAKVDARNEEFESSKEPFKEYRRKGRKNKKGK